MAIINQITAWSYSRYGTYKTCPMKAKCSILLKIKEPGNSAMDRGNLIHKMAEVHVTGVMDHRLEPSLVAHKETIEAAIKKLPPELAKFKTKFAQLKKAKALAEAQWTFTKDWLQTSWFAGNAWLRIKVDVHFYYAKKRLLEIDDHKTGKEHDDHADQRSLYALGGFLMYPEAQTIKAAHLYLDSGVTRDQTFTRDQFPSIQADWVDKTKSMLNDTRFAPTPGYHCKWCFFSKGKNGPCQY